jgi:hypothetical protein
VNKPDPDPLLSDVCLRFRSLPSDIPAPVRLRRLLKAALRSFGFKCLAVETPPNEPGVLKNNQNKSKGTGGLPRTG